MTELRRQNSLDKAVAALAALTEDDLDPLNGAVVERRVLLVNQYLTCKVCKGYFREAHTFKGCNHTFCKWCLMREFDRGVRTCPFPGCKEEWNGAGWNTAVAVDTQKQRIVELVLDGCGASEPPKLPTRPLPPILSLEEATRPSVREISTRSKRASSRSSVVSAHAGVPFVSAPLARKPPTPIPVTNSSNGASSVTKSVSDVVSRPRRVTAAGASSSASTSSATSTGCSASGSGELVEASSGCKRTRSGLIAGSNSSSSNGEKTALASNHSTPFHASTSTGAGASSSRGRSSSWGDSESSLSPPPPASLCRCLRSGKPKR